jgi:hypothetical protein
MSFAPCDWWYGPQNFRRLGTEAVERDGDGDVGRLLGSASGQSAEIYACHDVVRPG